MMVVGTAMTLHTNRHVGLCVTDIQLCLTSPGCSADCHTSGSPSAPPPALDSQCWRQAAPQRPESFVSTDFHKSILRQQTNKETVVTPVDSACDRGRTAPELTTVPLNCVGVLYQLLQLVRF